MSTSYVGWGFWTVQSQSFFNRYQLLLNDDWAGIFTNAIAVLITSTSGPLFNLLVKPINAAWDWVSSKWTTVQPAPVDDARDWQEAFDIILHNLPRAGWSHISLGGPRALNGPPPTSQVIGSGVMMIIVQAFPLVLLICSILSSALLGDTMAKSDSPFCGTYVFDSSSVPSNAPFLAYEHRAEAQASSIASDCYGNFSLMDSCDRFFAPNITYSVNTTAKCPFDGNACRSSVNSSIRLTTGMVSGSVLGINAPNPWSFSRTMTCSPIKVDDAYVSIGTSRQGDQQWEYRYGRSLTSDYTWANPVQDSLWEIKGYTTGVHCSNPEESDNPWDGSRFDPSPSFRAGPFPVTMVFINSHSILYPEYRDDPIFPAQQQAQLPPDYTGPKLWTNNSTRAGVMGCVDEYLICRSATGPCWGNENITSIMEKVEHEPATTENKVLALLLIALHWSTACGSIQFQGAEALDAQAKIAYMQSLPLAKQQLHVEAEKMFQTSLARMQLDIYDTVRGTAATYKGYRNELPPDYRGICTMVVIPTVGWRNINTIGMFGIILTVIILWIISRRTGSPGTETLIITLVWRKWLFPLSKDAFHYLGRGKRQLVDFFQGLWQYLVDHHNLKFP